MIFKGNVSRRYLAQLKYDENWIWSEIHEFCDPIFEHNVFYNTKQKIYRWAPHKVKMTKKRSIMEARRLLEDNFENQLNIEAITHWEF